MGSSDQPAPSLNKPSSRRLYGWEVLEFYRLFGDSMDYTKVRVHENTSFTDAIDRIGRRLKGMPPSSSGSHNAITLGNHCIFPILLPKEWVPTSDRESYKLPWLAHELTHAWQYQHQGWMYLVRAILAQVRERDKAYDYGGEDGLYEARRLGKRFHDFNPEQQGNIVQHYYARMRMSRDIRVFQSYINDLQGLDEIRGDRSLV
jgi:hypothetical protein